MSMIIFCQSNMNLCLYGLKDTNDIGMTHIKAIINQLDFLGKTWSNDSFCILWDESLNILNSWQKGEFQDTPVFHFLDSICDLCDEIAIFHCSPLSNKADWNISNNKEDFLSKIGKALHDEVPYSYDATFLFCKISR